MAAVRLLQIDRNNVCVYVINIHSSIVIVLINNVVLFRYVYNYNIIHKSPILHIIITT